MRSCSPAQHAPVAICSGLPPRIRTGLAIAPPNNSCLDAVSSPVAPTLAHLPPTLPPVQQWQNEIAFSQMKAAYEEVHSIGLDLDGRGARMSLQSYLLTVLCEHTGKFDYEKAIAHRLRTFGKDVDGFASQAEMFAKKAVDNLSRMLAVLPITLVAAYFRSVCNAWTTTHRYNLHTVAPCSACGAAGSDFLMHYAVCPTIANFAMRHLSPLRGILVRPSFTRFFGFSGSSSREGILALAVLHDVTHSLAINGRLRPSGSSSESQCLARLKVLKVRHSVLRGVFRGA